MKKILVAATFLLALFQILGSGNAFSRYERAAAPTAVPMKDLQYEYGQIAAINLRTGQLMLEERQGAVTGPRVEYVITRQATSVTDSKDNQFLQLEDLTAGQFVRVEFLEQGGRRLVQSVVVESQPVIPSSAQWISGEVLEIDLRARQITVSEIIPGRAPPEIQYRIFCPAGTFIADAQTGQPLQVEDVRLGQRISVAVAAPAVGSVLQSPPFPAAPPIPAGWNTLAGEIESVDARSMVLELREIRPGWKATETVPFRLSVPDTQVTDLRSGRVLQLEDLQAGDRVEVRFTVEPGGHRLGRQIIVYGSARS